jgi:HK97 family phage prohead protease
MRLEKFSSPSPALTEVSQQYDYFWQPPPWSITNPSERIVEGYASMPNLDDQGDVVPVEAIEAALPSFMEWGTLRAMHTKIAAGKVLAARVDRNGLWIKAQVTDDDSWQKVQNGTYLGFSIGGDVKDIAHRPDGSRMITAIRLNEISLVDRPANPQCRISVVKFVASHAGEELTQQTPVTAEAVVSEPEPVEKKVGPGEKRPDTNPQQGVRDYGDVSFGDPTNKKYPLDSEGHIRRGWNYINMPKNQRFYTPDAVANIKRRIVAAWKKKIDPKGPPGAKDDSQLKKTSQPHKNLAMTVAELEQFKATLVDPEQIATIDKALGLVKGKSADVEKASTTSDNESETDKALFEPDTEKAAPGVPSGSEWAQGSEEDVDDKEEDKVQTKLDPTDPEPIDRWDFLENKVPKGKREKAADADDLTKCDDKAEKSEKIKGKKKPGPTAEEDQEDDDGDEDDMEKASGISSYHKALGNHLAGAIQAVHKCMKALGSDNDAAESHLGTVHSRLQAAQKVHKAMKGAASTEKALGVQRSDLLDRIEKLEDLVTEHEGNLELIAARSANFEIRVEKLFSQIPASRAVRAATVQPKDDLDDFPQAYKEMAATRNRALGR